VLPQVSRRVGCDRVSTGQVSDVAFRFESKGVQEEEEIIILEVFDPKDERTTTRRNAGKYSATQRHFPENARIFKLLFCRAFTKLRKATTIFVMSIRPHGTSRLSLGLFS